VCAWAVYWFYSVFERFGSRAEAGFQIAVLCFGCAGLTRAPSSGFFDSFDLCFGYRYILVFRFLVVLRGRAQGVLGDV
jgi:hypothetical protein